jgi:protein-ribulosamine 3-kinase
MIRQPRYRFTQEYVNRYKGVIPPSEPVQDVDDQNALYAMRDNTIDAGLHEHRAHLREELVSVNCAKTVSLTFRLK